MHSARLDGADRGRGAGGDNDKGGGVLDINNGKLFMQHNGELVEVGIKPEIKINTGEVIGQFKEALKSLKTAFMPLIITFSNVKIGKQLRNIADKNHKTKKRYKNIGKARVLMR